MGKNQQVELHIPQTVYVNVPSTFLNILQHTETIQIEVTTKLNTPLVHLIVEGGNVSTPSNFVVDNISQCHGASFSNAIQWYKAPSSDLIEEARLFSNLGDVVDDTIANVEDTKTQGQVENNIARNLEIVPSAVLVDEGRAT